MLYVIWDQIVKHFLADLFGASLGNCPFHQLSQSVSHKKSHLIDGVLGVRIHAQGIIYGICNILQRIQYCSVHIKDS